MQQFSAESLEHVVEDDPRKQLELSVPRYEPGEWKYEFQMLSFSTTILNLLFTEAEQKGKTRNFRAYIGLGSDGSSADKMSLDLKFNPWDTAITFRPEWRSMSKTVFTQYESFETWYTCQSDVWPDGVKTFYPRPMRCVIVVHPCPLAQEDTTLLTDSASLSCAKICIDDSRFTPDLHKDKRVRLNKRMKNEIIQQRRIHHRNHSGHVESTDQHHFAQQNDHAYGDSSDLSKYDGSWTFFLDFDPVKNRQQLTGDSVTRLKNEFATNDLNVIFRTFQFRTTTQHANASDKVIIIADTRHTLRWSEREVDPMLCRGDLAFFCNCPVTLENLRLWAHERTPVSHETWTSWKQSNLRTFSERSLKINV